MPRSSILDREKIFKLAMELIDKNGLDKLSIRDLAKHLKIKPASLYNHIDGLAELKVQIAGQSTLLFYSTLSKAVSGKEGKVAILELAKSYRNFALKHPGLYQIIIVVPYENAESWKPVADKMRELFTALLRKNYQFSDLELRSAARALRVLLHGFVSLEHACSWSQIVDVESSFEQSLDYLMQGFEAASTLHSKT